MINYRTIRDRHDTWIWWHNMDKKLYGFEKCVHDLVLTCLMIYNSWN